MAGYNRDIVATRKLNNSNKAKLGRGGDTKIRTVDGRKSHVNAFEAYMIDVKGRVGQEYTKKVGSGTINPYTGMPEYHELTPAGRGEDALKIMEIHNSTWDSASGTHSGGGEGYGSEGFTDFGSGDIDADWKSYQQGSFAESVIDPTYENLSSVTASQLTGFDENLGADDVQYFQDIFSDKPFEFLKTEQTRALSGIGLQEEGLGLQEKQLGIQDKQLGLERRKLASSRDMSLASLDLGERKLGSDRGRSLAALDLGERKLASGRDRSLSALDLGERKLASSRDFQLGALGSQQKALGTSTGRGLGQASGARDVAASRSGFATSGSVTQGFEAQKQGLMQDYTAGTKDISRQRAGVQADYGFGMEQSAQARSGVAADYGFGMAQSRADRAGVKTDWTFGVEQIGLDREGIGVQREGLALDQKGLNLDRLKVGDTFAKGTYAEEQRQLDDYWNMIGLRQGAV